MRTIQFREILNGVAYKLGLDPDQSNFLSNQAVSIGTYIDQWIRRTFDSEDWPEWTVTDKAVPKDHVVPWDYDRLVGTNLIGHIGRMIAVFLIDPNTTSCPVETPFTLADNGVNVGFEHGSHVWLRYMPIPPKFTAVSWRPDTTFQKDDVTYSSRSGEVYKSKANGNVNHDPSTSFSLPLLPEHIDHQPLPPPTTEVTQFRTPDNPGMAARTEILVLTFKDAFTNTPAPDPPANGDSFRVKVNDFLTTAVLANELFTANGTNTLNDVIDGLVTQLGADPDLSTFTITGDHTAKTITLEHASVFNSAGSLYTIASEGGVTHQMKYAMTQTYSPAVPTVLGASQITRTTITDDTTYAGQTYEMKVIGSDGLNHSVSYPSNDYDGPAQILEGLMVAAQAAAATDTYWSDVTFALDTNGVTLDMTKRDDFSTQHSVEIDAPSGSPWWELVPFPRNLAEQVIEGAYSDLLKEWGQTDKGMAEQQQVAQEVGVTKDKFTTMPTPALTGQQAPLSRYRIR